MRHKVGAYVRVSTEEQAQVIEGSLDSQRHRLKAFVDLKNVQEDKWGKIVEVYADEGFSAKDTRRPALQRLMNDLRIGRINLILVTDLSRLSRNILDFCLMLEDLKTYNGKFLSVKEQFDTTTAAGEMMVFNMINLAQFERKQTAERVSQNFHSRAMRGLLNGAPAILGYDKNPANGSQYIVNEDEALIVREVYRIFLDEGSIAKTVRRLNETKVPRKCGSARQLRLASQGVWTYMGLRAVLQNKAYIGIREVNKKYRGRDPDELRSWQQFKEAKASWPAIVPEDIFEKAQRHLAAGKCMERPRSHHLHGSPFILTGLLKCGECGAPFVGETGHGRISDHRYYGHKQYAAVSFKCSVRRFLAEDAEEAVEDHLSSIALNPKGLEPIEIAIGQNLDMELSDIKKERERVRLRLSIVEKETQQVFRVLGEMTAGTGLSLVKEKIESLGAERAALTEKLREIEDRIERAGGSKSAVDALKGHVLEFKAGWRKGSLAKKKQLLRGLVSRLEVRPDCLGLFYRIPSEQCSGGTPAKVFRPGFGTAAETRAGVDFQNEKAVGNFVIPTANFDVVDCIGGPDRNNSRNFLSPRHHRYTWNN